jgi:hypothetical protein
MIIFKMFKFNFFEGDFLYFRQIIKLVNYFRKLLDMV